MRLNIVVKRGWILERMARELEKAIPGVAINCGERERAIDPGADLNYYMPAKDVLKFPSERRTVGLWTHGQILPEILAGLTACTAMNEKMGEELRKRGVRHVTVIHPGTEPPRRPAIFGVVGRAYSNGRKGPEFVAAAVEAGFSFVACAPKEKIRATARGQWHCPITHTTQDREAFYHSIDYLVVTSLEEGGPIPVLEAIARKVPVIAPDVGFCWEFPCYHFERGSWESLRSVLEGLTRPPTWQGWIDAHAALFKRLTRRAA